MSASTSSCTAADDESAASSILRCAASSSMSRIPRRPVLANAVTALAASLALARTVVNTANFWPSPSRFFTALARFCDAYSRRLKRSRSLGSASADLAAPWNWREAPATSREL